MTLHRECSLVEAMLALLGGESPQGFDWPDEKEAYAWRMIRWESDMPLDEAQLAALQEAMQQKIRQEKHKPQSIVKKKTTNSAILEVDLHIHELLDNVNGLSNSDMLNYQLEKFREVLNQYAAQKGQKIVFIHGKGDGVLRKAIETELKTKYKNYYYQDASFREYGYGATMVTIK